MWWITLDEFITDETEAVLAELAKGLESLVKANPDESSLIDELICVGCLYAPSNSYHTWLMELAARLREKADPNRLRPKFTLRRPKNI